MKTFRFLLAVLFFSLGVTARAEVRLPALFSDGMVLQREMPVRIWGWAAPGEPVTVRFADQSRRAVADASGRWQATLDPLPVSGEPRDLTVNDRVVKAVLVGEVWLCSGQSNMEMALHGAANGMAEAAKAEHPQIRFFTVGRQTALEPQADCRGTWMASAPSTADAFSAVGYYFGRRVHAELGVPVGLILAAWGGTVAESWISRAGLTRETAEARERDTAGLSDPPPPIQLNDAGWEKPDFADADWKTIQLPLYWDYALYPVEYDGVIWARRQVELPATWAGKELRLDLDKVDDFETTFFHGREVGRTTTHTLAPRSYVVPAGLVKPGPAVIAVRTTKVGWGGICGAKDGMKLAPADGAGPAIPLAGEWKYRAAELTFRNFSPRLPSSLHDGMIAPLTPFTLRGAIWYQGEANAYGSAAFHYRRTLPTLIADWRRAWPQGEFPFYLVQLPNFRAPTDDPNAASDWAVMRESQVETLAVTNTGLAVTIDLGEANDIHPKSKRAVGERLALQALAKTYAKPVACDSPRFESLQIEGDQIRVKFRFAASGLVTRDGGPVKGFAIAGADTKFVWADAAIEGDSVVVSSRHVREPVAVRYAWADNPVCNLFSRDGLPVCPFRSDAPAPPRRASPSARPSAPGPR